MIDKVRAYTFSEIIPYYPILSRSCWIRPKFSSYESEKTILKNGRKKEAQEDEEAEEDCGWVSITQGIEGVHKDARVRSGGPSGGTCGTRAGGPAAILRGY